MPHSRIAAASSGTSSSCLLKHGKLSTLAHPSFYHWTGRYHSIPVDGSCFLILSFYWIGRLHTNPIRSRVHTPPVPSGSTVFGKHLPRTPPRAAVDIEDADTVDGEVATERTVPELKLGLQPKLAPGPSCRLKGVDLVCHRLVLGVFLGHQNHSLNFHLLCGWYFAALRGRRLRCGML